MKPKMGRPKKPKGMVKTKTLQICLTGQERALFDRKAKTEGIGASALGRKIILASL
jgi:hypothetical protein